MIFDEVLDNLQAKITKDFFEAENRRNRIVKLWFTKENANWEKNESFVNGSAVTDNQWSSMFSSF